MEMAQLGLFWLLGLLTGVMTGFFGIGGGMVIVPTLLLAGYSYDGAVGISILQMVCSSVAGSVANFRKGLLDLRVGFWVGLGGLMGAGFSGAILTHVPHKILLGLFILMTFYSLLRFFLKSKKSTGKKIKSAQLQPKDKVILIAIGALTGIFAISLGIGGGVLMVSLLSYYLGLDPKQSVPLSLFFVVFSSISGVASLYQSHILEWQYLQWGLLVGVGSVLGVLVGVRLITKVSTLTHRYALIMAYLVCLAVSLYKFFTLG
ncbi:integral membrane protein [Helicobacter bizzozeronii CIII-1]|uniref:Probable membrane transporter protein n=1 Tax=Helicobacter bizzozeronii (strain CIII-1) TaxID=1002804 RepID=F8KQ18_HELBC|nr:sulfite exporter TauE/SafE family protein [Helicobacter bizzozeronii]CCB79365.1 integral membrane protein [Helicobacter bizzozeronii CIII-1]